MNAKDGQQAPADLFAQMGKSLELNGDAIVGEMRNSELTTLQATLGGRGTIEPRMTEENVAYGGTHIADDNLDDDYYEEASEY